MVLGQSQALSCQRKAELKQNCIVSRNPVLTGINQHCFSWKLSWERAFSTTDVAFFSPLPCPQWGENVYSSYIILFFFMSPNALWQYCIWQISNWEVANNQRTINLVFQACKKKNNQTHTHRMDHAQFIGNSVQLLTSQWNLLGL